MLSKKTKALFVEVNGFNYLIAAVSGLQAPLTLESLHEFPRTGTEALREFLQTSGTGSGTSPRYISAHCGVLPESRFIRLHALESMAKAKEAGYFDNVMEQQYKINGKSTRAALLSAETGEAFSASKPIQVQKQVLICGADNAELDRLQEQLVDCGIYPESMQLSTLSCLAGMKHYLQYKEIKDPVLCLDVTLRSANLFVLNRERVEMARNTTFGFNSVFPVLMEQLGLKNEQSASDLFFSNTFDFREMGSELFKRLLKEINASTGYYEVQTGQTIGHLLVAMLPPNLSWIGDVIAQEMDIPTLEVDYSGWAESMGIQFGEGASAAQLGPNHFALMSLFAKVESLDHATAGKK